MTLPVRSTDELLPPDPRNEVGRFSYDVVDDAWWWSDETYRLLGFEPHEVVPTWSLMLSHQHVDDRHEVQEVFEGAVRTGEPFSTVHRITDAHGRERTLSDTGQGRCDPATGAVTHVDGFHADVSSVVERLGDARATASIRASAASRAGIEQAKGIVAFALGTDPESAFALLREASSHGNVPLRQIAEIVVEAAARPDRDLDQLAATLDELAPR